MDHLYTFDDVLIEPCFSTVKSRKDIDLSSSFLNLKLQLPVMNANMDTVSSVEMCNKMFEQGGIGTLHRFCSIEKNVEIFKAASSFGIPVVSLGVGKDEMKRARALVNAGANVLLLDVAHAASYITVDMFNELKTTFLAKGIKYIVGNFGTGKEVLAFLERVTYAPDAVKVGIGGGSLCTTRLVTGVGIPTLSSILDVTKALKSIGSKVQIIGDGGIRHVGDIVKALVAGADTVMLGSMLAGTEESSGKFISNQKGSFKEYRGSASLGSYEVQGKVATWRAPEGEATLVSYKGPVINILNNINGGIRSACSYVNAFNLNDLRKNAKFNFVTGSTIVENSAHGK
jgi:IMP dehydrogenase